MYNSVFMNCYSTNIYNTLGALSELKEDLSDIIIWNTLGNSSLIIFLKILGFNYNQMFEILKEFDICKSFINGFTVMVENEDEKKTYIKNFLISIFKKNNFIKKDIVLKEVYEITNIFPCFLIWDKLNEKICNINPSNNPGYKLIDCVMCSLTGIGTYTDFTICENLYSNLNSLDCFPYKHVFTMEENNLNTLFIFNNMNYGFEGIDLNFGPLTEIENELLKQQFDRNKLKLQVIKENIQSNNLLIINSEFYREKLEYIKLDGFFKSGVFQAKSFREGEDTKKGIEKHLSLILNQV